MPLSEDALRHYIGGSGLGAHLLLDEGRATTEPLSPEAPLIFAFSPLVGSPLTTSAKFAVVTRSPLTGRFNDSLASSGFAIAGKQAGCDAIVLVGKAPRLSVLVIDDGNVRLVNGRLYLDALPLIPLSATLFESTGATAEFSLDASGRVTRMVLGQTEGEAIYTPER